jgi:hypothetical protein
MVVAGGLGQRQLRAEYAIMSSRREHQAWLLVDHANREYRSDEERRFFEAIKNPPSPTKELKEIVREFGQFVVGID